METIWLRKLLLQPKHLLNVAIHLEHGKDMLLLSIKIDDKIKLKYKFSCLIPRIIDTNVFYFRRVLGVMQHSVFANFCNNVANIFYAVFVTQK